MTGPAAAGAPEVRLLDARAPGLDEGGLRTWARTQTATCGALHVTRSYSFPYALVAWHSEPVGIDIELLSSCDSAFADSICTPAERVGSARLGDSDVYLTSLWCSKEALAKALGDAILYEPRRLDSPMHWPEGQAGVWRAAALEGPSRHAAWLCWRASRARAGAGSGGVAHHR